jgi:tetratricopeptide (TPR) repeat protein
MSFTYSTRLLLLLACLLAGSHALAGDAASNPPASLAGSLRAITDVKLDNVDTEARHSIQLARRQLNEALQAQPVETDKLAAAYGELGSFYHVHFVFPAAENCYHNAAQLDPDEFRWVYYAAWLIDTNGPTEQALQLYEKARTLKPGYKALMIRLGNALLDLNELDRAQAAFAQITDAAGLEAASLYGLGQVALLRREYETAIDAFSRALTFDPAASRIHYPLALALRATRRNDEAKAQLALRGDQPPTFRDPQIESLEALKIGSRIHFIQAMKAIKRQDYTAASESFAKGLESEPDNVLARISYARTLYLIGKKTEARQALQAALAIQPDNSLGLFLLGVLSEDEGDVVMAADDYRRALQYTPEHAGAHHYLANQYYREGDYAAAAIHYVSSLKGEPDNLGAMIPCLDTLLLSNAPAATLMAELEIAIQRFPEYPGFQPLQILLLTSSSDTNIRDPERALKIAQQLNEQHPVPPHQELLALAYAATGNYEQATAILEILLSYTPQQGLQAEADRLARTLSYYRENRIPPLDELIDRSAFRPPAFNASAPFRDYPAPRPY